jgi:autotransporter-associated beta strand protein
MSHLRRLLLRAHAVVALASVTVPLGYVPAQAATDITGQVRAGENVELAGDAVITLGDGEEILYGGVFSGVGTLTVRGSGKLVLTADSDFQIPEDRRRQRPEVLGITNHPFLWMLDADPPAVTVEAGATLQYGDGAGGTTGRIGHYPYDYANFAWNALNHHVDGTLIVAVAGALYHPGILSGAGVLNQPRFIWEGVELAGDHSFSGTIVNGTGVHVSRREYLTLLPNLSKLVNYGSFMVDTPHDHDTVLGFDVFSREWGNDINFYGATDGSRVIMSGVYSWSDQGTETDPSLSDPDLNYVAVPKNINKRGVNIQGAIVQWGDGTHNRFFLPGTRETVYINLYTRRARGHLVFDYNGPVTLGAPISGGRYHDTMAAVAVGDVTIAGTPGNDVTFADQQNYDGTTTIEAGATLRLGTGDPGQDSWLITGTEGASIVDDGALVVRNAEQAVELSRISGAGSFEQAGPAPVTFTGDIAYTGPTTVSGGALAIAGGSIASSGSVNLTNEGAALDLTGAGDQTVRNLRGVRGSTLRLGATTMTVASTKDTRYGGGVEGAGGVVKTGPAILTYAGTSKAEGPWAVAEGTLALAGARLAGDVVVDKTLAVSGRTTVGGDLTLRGKPTLRMGSGAALKVAGDVALSGTLEVRHQDGVRLPRELPVITSGGAITGKFAGLDEGARIKVGGKAYEISYAADRVVLAVPTPAVVPSAKGAAVEAAAPAGAPTGGFSPAVVIVPLLALGLGGLAFVLLRRRRGTAGPRHARLRAPGPAEAGPAASAVATPEAAPTPE